MKFEYLKDLRIKYLFREVEKQVLTVLTFLRNPEKQWVFLLFSSKLS